ncbi:high-affinity choline transporter 1-like [Ischnura elegans]|uniref:high-affinity choline transporter 1-like n=1 Tax=Ischnura elegans TaxID=197161 RepID=UPI001ED8AE3E|nr:high-affinity choline transporter 1-like [Ischnura elegans]
MLVVGVSGLVVFYLSVMAIGIWAGSKRGAHRVSGGELQGALLAGRALPLPIGLFSLLATCMGAEALIGGIPEAVFVRGVVWCHFPIGYCLSFLIGGLCFSGPMRSADYETLLDPIQRRFGPRVGAFVSAPAILGDILRSAAVLSSLGSALAVVLDMSWSLSVVGTAVFAAIYTLLGGLFSVAYTDAAQVSFVTLGLVLSAPFAASHPSASRTLSDVDWVGEVTLGDPGRGPWHWLDALLLFALGAIPSQSYVQRVLATSDARAARLLSFAASGCCLVLALPSMVIGVIAKATDWEAVEGWRRNVTSGAEARSVLPLVVRFMTPEWVSFIGLGAVSAAVMSSVDSSYLSASSLLAKNVYRVILRPKAPDPEVLWVLRCGVVASAAASAALALAAAPSIVPLALFCADLVYVMVFPQLLLSVMWSDGANSYGAIAAALLGATLRVLGDPELDVPALVRYPLFDDDSGTQGAPHRTIAMLAALAAHVVASRAATALLGGERPWLHPKYDCLGCFNQQQQKVPAIPGVLKVRFSDDPDEDLEVQQSRCTRKAAAPPEDRCTRDGEAEGNHLRGDEEN